MSPSKTSVTEALNFETFTNTINGESRTTEKTRTGINPATKQPLPAVPVSTPKDLDDAVNAAREAYPKWRDTPYAERKRRVLEWGNAIAKHSESFVKMLVQEQGKPVHLAKVEIGGIPNQIKKTCSIELPEDVVEENDDGKIVVRYTPLGVAAGIVPWNCKFWHSSFTSNSFSLLFI